MTTSRPAAGGGRWVDVDPDRLSRWVEGFRERHGAYAQRPTDDGLLLAAFDGATAELHPPPGAPFADDLADFVETARAPRHLGLLLARKAAVAVGVADGTRLVTSKVDSSYVQSRTAAGGWSQQRFARRRDNQAKAAAKDAADLAARLLLPATGELAALVCGGDRRTVDAILADPRLAPLLPLRADRLLDVTDPRHAVLVDAVAAARAVSILVRDPDS
ncbi:hypothetical protein SAMN05421812_114117 [Asanoa hainanensis]|uniref:Actinobacteria/chloroflexi VLRF1 release factor domain-containing protein n=1 Tax=Asanoa hainanensis TaxID=560556 RepID=A0A239P6U3_9ACTN|nr:acVLRF1 family peptidyl-tRNA hydrolase [Asanoa hainanensis]SNT62563.1 hypothetical protein SAMN05421812_114117 [Asanoa hainanensis]